METPHCRYSYRPLHLHHYMLFLYLCPLSLLVQQHMKPVLIVLFFLFKVSFLSTFWNVKILLFQCYSYSKTGSFIVYENTICKVQKEGGAGVESFECHKQKYLIEDKKISPLRNKLNYTLKEYRSGITIMNYDLFPLNEFKVPSPTFLALFKEQCVTPLFCFQVFSSLLMCFDEHVMNSLFSTAMIISVEASMVFSRVSNMKIFRKLEHKPIEVRRIKKGSSKATIPPEQISSYLLKPGDSIVIDSVADVPCDLLILDGSCAVNEAMLSGESAPLFKEEAANTNEEFSFSEHRNNILFAGTRLEKIYSPLTCVVLRTAFCTEQGALLAKMLKSEDIKYDPEAFKFILLLTSISLINSVFTYKYSKKTGYALFLDLIILFTNSIPFELPMEMGMSVQSAVKNLMKKKVYCLEPFRITLAGKVNVCCFDKTGTLTNTKMEVKHIKYENRNTNKVLSSCHNLINVDGELKGDPLDLAICSFEFEKIPFNLKKQFTFASELKRQGVVCEIKGKLCYCLKGAPEEIRKYLNNEPEEYENYKTFASEGYRVISLAYRELSMNDLKLSEDRLSDREYLEKEMEFCGFVLVGSSLKDYAVEMCRILRDADIKVLMITGDNILTATNVADQLKLKGKGVQGKEIETVLEKKDFEEFSIFGRAEPKHKEMIIKKYQSLGYHVMMVGDGTNDVGALKAADVGVAMLECQEVLANKNQKPISRLEQLKAEVATLESIRPGDASVAAPFTVRSNSLGSIIEIIQQGRSSLVTTIQMYKILALNSIISGFFMMTVDVLGIKFSDAQMISIGILSSVGFSAITQPRTLSTISKEKPLTSIFNLYIFVSIFLQTVIQLGPLYALYKLVPISSNPPAKFEPSVMNTCLFVISSVQTLSTFVCNYIGRPFREDLLENKALLLSLGGIIGFIANVIMKFHEDLNSYIQVVDISSYLSPIIILSVAMVALSFVAERVCFKLFLINK